jgi:hypothetical protein
MCGFREKIVAPGLFVATLVVHRGRPLDPVSTNGGFRCPEGGVDRFQSACKMQYDADVGQLKPPMREEAM